MLVYRVGVANWVREGNCEAHQLCQGSANVQAQR